MTALTAMVIFIPSAVTGELNQGVAGVSLDVLFPGADFDPAIATQAEVTGVDPRELQPVGDYVEQPR